jgi:hypothetical protein
MLGPWIAKGMKPKSVLALLLSHKAKAIDVDWPPVSLDHFVLRELK